MPTDLSFEVRQGEIALLTGGNEGGESGGLEIFGGVLKCGMAGSKIRFEGKGITALPASKMIQSGIVRMSKLPRFQTHPKKRLVMAHLIEVTLDENTKIYLETVQDLDVKKGQFQPVGNTSGVIKKANDYFEGSLHQIKSFANKVASSVKDLDASPDEVELEFSVKFAAEAGVIISSLNSEASVKIKLKWSNTK